MQNKKFEVLNDEKMTSHFVSLTKIKGQDVIISDICNDAKVDFRNSDERSSHVKNFFVDLYKKPNENNLMHRWIWGDFAQNQMVEGAKLTEEDRLSLDQPITFAELDKSINGANMKWACTPILQVVLSSPGGRNKEIGTNLVS